VGGNPAAYEPPLRATLQMSYLDAILLGILQGLTEFLPISSSGHLVLTQYILGVKAPGLTFELLAHAGTQLAVLVFFRKQVCGLIRACYTPSMKEERRMVLLLIMGTIPAALAGFFGEEFFEEAFSNPLVTSCMLLVTGALLLFTRFVPKREDGVKGKSALLMGLGQAVAIMPGISRSGSTIAVGMLLGVQPSRAAEFSFLLAIPAISGALVLKFRDLLAIDAASLGIYLTGTFFAFVFGLLAVYVVLSAIRKGKFEYFAYYCFAVGLLGLYLFI